MKIYKYELETDKENVISMPISAEVIHCHEQKNKACIWIKFTESEEMEIRKFICMVTGIYFDGGDYVGTAHLDSGKFVLHIFETTYL